MIEKKYIVKDVRVLNKLTTGSDQRMVPAKVMTNISKERYRLIRKTITVALRDPKQILPNDSKRNKTERSYYKTNGTKNNHEKRIT